MCYLLVYYKQKHRNIQFTRRWITNRNILFFFFGKWKSNNSFEMSSCFPALQEEILTSTAAERFLRLEELSAKCACSSSKAAFCALWPVLGWAFQWCGCSSGIPASMSNPVHIPVNNTNKNAVTSQLGLQCGHYFGLSWVPFLGICVCVCVLLFIGKKSQNTMYAYMHHLHMHVTM